MGEEGEAIEGEGLMEELVEEAEATRVGAEGGSGVEDVARVGSVETDEADEGRREDVAVDEGTPRVLVHDCLEIDDELGERLRIEEVSVLLVFADDEDECREEGVDVASGGGDILRVYVDHMVWRALVVLSANREDAILRTEKQRLVSAPAQCPCNESRTDGCDDGRFGAEERGDSLEADVCSLAGDDCEHGAVDAAGEASEVEGGGVGEVVWDRDTLEMGEGEDVGAVHQHLDCFLLVGFHGIWFGKDIVSRTGGVGVAGYRVGGGWGCRHRGWIGEIKMKCNNTVW